MEPGRARDPDDDVTALEAVWGREASATAPPASRPDLSALLDAGDDDAGDDGDLVPRPRARRVLLGAGLAAALVVVLVGALVLVGGGDDPGGDDRRAATTTTVPDDGVLGEPAWTVPVTCRPAPDAGSAPICPVAIDDERAYVLVDRDGTATVEARSVDDGVLLWEVPIPDGAATLRRLPATVLVLGVGPGWETVSLDPITGAERWRAPGTFVGPIGRDHVLLDGLVGADTEERGTMTVLHAGSGQVVMAPEGTPASLYVHPCDAAGMAVVRQDGMLTARTVPGDVIRWSVPVTGTLDAFNQVHCDERTVAYVDGGTLHLRDAATGAEIGTTTVAPADPDERVTVLAVVAGTVVVGSSEGARGFRADAELEQLWRLRCRVCGPTFPVGAAADDGVVVVIGGEAVVPEGAEGGSGPRFDLEGRTEVELAAGSVLAWGAAGVVVVDTAELARPVRLEEGDVRQAAAGSTHLVVTTLDAVRAYPLES